MQRRLTAHEKNAASLREIIESRNAASCLLVERVTEEYIMGSILQHVVRIQDRIIEAPLTIAGQPLKQTREYTQFCHPPKQPFRESIAQYQ